MQIRLSGAVCAAALLLACGVSDAHLSPAAAQMSAAIGFDRFHDRLARYGDWVYSDRWGEVWIPDTDADFKPYDTNGHWAYTDDYGWVWASDYAWGDIPFHYGRWVNDPDDGWLWLPGYVWSPAWVAWRSNGSYIGWMPLPPDDEFLGVRPSRGGVHFSVDFNDTGGYYGYSRWYGSRYDGNRFASNWVFVGTSHIADRDFHRYAAPPTSNITIIRGTRNVTNYTVVNNHVVNRSVDIRAVNRAGGNVQSRPLAQLVRNQDTITTVNQGQQRQAQARIDRPRGTGTPNSAPRPSLQVIQSLSVRVPQAGGRTPRHLFTRDTVTAAPLAPSPRTPPEHAMPVAPNATPSILRPDGRDHMKPAGSPANIPTLAPTATPRPAQAPPNVVPPPPNNAPPVTTAPATPQTVPHEHREHPAPAATPAVQAPQSSAPVVAPPAPVPHEHRDRAATVATPAAQAPQSSAPVVAPPAPAPAPHEHRDRAAPVATPAVPTPPVVKAPAPVLPEPHPAPVAPPVIVTPPVATPPPVTHEHHDRAPDATPPKPKDTDDKDDPKRHHEDGD